MDHFHSDKIHIGDSGDLVCWTCNSSLRRICDFIIRESKNPEEKFQHVRANWKDFMTGKLAGDDVSLHKVSGLLQEAYGRQTPPAN